MSSLGDPGTLVYAPGELTSVIISDIFRVTWTGSGPKVFG